MDVAGGPAFFKGSVIERAYRDIRASKFHPLTPEATPRVGAARSRGARSSPVEGGERREEHIDRGAAAPACLPVALRHRGRGRDLPRRGRDARADRELVHVRLPRAATGLVSVARSARATGHLGRVPFSVNVLGASQLDVALHFAGRPQDPVAVAWHSTGDDLAPTLAGARWRRSGAGRGSPTTAATTGCTSDTSWRRM